MEDPNMTMEEYIKFEEEKARRRGRVFNWKTVTYGKIKVDYDLYDLRSMEAEFQAIVINDVVAPQDELQCKSQFLYSCDFLIDFANMALPPREQRHGFLRYEGLEYTYSDIADFESRMAMEHRDEAGVVVFTIRLGVGCLALGDHWFGSLFWSSLAHSDLE
ncbi:hypothetical protein Tco_1358467, partial [Tanacetum coccineum]